VLSNFVRSELCRYYPFLESERVHVLYPGYNQDFQSIRAPADAAVLQKYGLTPGYLLTVSSIHPRKNLQGLLNAHQLLKQRLASDVPRLVVVGQQYWGDQGLQSRAQALEIDLLGYVSQPDLPALYRGARLFVYPSLYEGFGLPPVEAMASGVPVICGDNSALPEAVGDAAHMVDMSAPAAIADAVASLLRGDERREHWVKVGLEWVKRFSWQQTAERLADALAQ
jgi:alpha-1,3-rhamnosyl/mannosyltransferase